jgi:beta-lactamase regulating signal transducer with metallopeptidase domain
MMDRMVTEYIVNSLWQIPVLAAGAWLLIRLLDPTPIVQHRIWVFTLGLAILFPMHDVSSRHAVSSPVLTATGSDGPYIWRTAVASGVAEPSSLREGWPPQDRKAWLPAWNLKLSAATGRMIVALYLVIIFCGLSRVIRGWFAARNLVKQSESAVLPAKAAQIFEDCCSRRRMTAPRVRVSTDVLSPSVVGILKPVVLMPGDFAKYTEDELEAAVRHELAHVLRRDYLLNLLYQLSSVPLMWHPVVPAIQRRISSTREMICDAMAADEMPPTPGYARCLMSLSQNMLHGRHRAEEAQAIGLFENYVLEERLMRLTETKAATRLRVRVLRIAAGVTVMAVSLGLTTMLHVTSASAKAQEATAPVAPAAPQAARAPSNEVAPVAVVAPAAVSAPAPVAPPADLVAPVDVTAPVVVEGPIEVPEKASKDKAAPQPRKHSGEVNLKGRGLTAEEQERIQKEIAAAQKEIEEAASKFNSPEFREQIASAQRESSKAAAFLNSQEFKRQMEDAKRQMQISQQAMAEAAAKTNSPEFKRQMAMAQQKAAEATARLNSPEFKEEMAAAGRRAAEATAYLNSAEFKSRMEDAAKQIEAARKQIEQSKMLKEGQAK